MANYGKKFRRQTLPRLESLDGRKIATLHTDHDGRIFALKVGDVDRHKLWKAPGPGFAFDDTALDQARTHGVKYYVFRDRSTGFEWFAMDSDFRQHGRSFDRGFGPQTVLHERFWRSGNHPPEPPEPTCGVQLELFEQCGWGRSRRAA